MDTFGTMTPIAEATHWAQHWLLEMGISENWIAFFSLTLDTLVLVLASILADFIMRKLVMVLIRHAVARTEAKWDDYFLQERVFHSGVHLITGLLIRGFIQVIFEDFPKTGAVLVKCVTLYIIWQLVQTVNKSARAMAHVLEDNPKFKDKPVQTLLQVVQFVSWIFAFLGAISVFLNTPMMNLLGALAGATAIVILIFQDAINGLLANFQISMYNLLKKGDWITFEKYGVDGDVESIDLTTVKIKNFDNTISSVPAKAFVTDSFQNWRGMRQSKVRRIKRSLFLDLNSVVHADSALLEQLKKVQILEKFIAEKIREIDLFNEEMGADKSLALNGRHLTNAGLFRAYVSAYLESHSQVSKKDPFVVRQLQPTPQGLPLELYCFVKEIKFEEYETLAADIMDHIIAAVPTFGLQMYQTPTGRDDFFLAKRK